MKDTVITYLKDTYHPRALLIYGSYVRGDYDEYSDFDCMIIVDKKNKKHDNSVINWGCVGLRHFHRGRSAF